MGFSPEQRAIHLTQYDAADRVKVMRSSFTEKEGWEVRFQREWTLSDAPHTDILLCYKALEWMTSEQKEETLQEILSMKLLTFLI